MGSELQLLRNHLAFLVREHDLGSETVRIMARPLTPEEAIGRTSRTDFPLVIGRERLIEARFRGARGQAFTDMPADFRATLAELLELELVDNAYRAFFVASVNAVCRHLFSDLRTVHCRDDDPERCGVVIARKLMERFGRVRVGVIGLNPAILDGVSSVFGVGSVLVTDMDRARIGNSMSGVRICDARRETTAVVSRSDVLLATGTTFANGTVDLVSSLARSHGKPLVFYGVTCAGAARLLGHERLCPFAS